MGGKRAYNYKLGTATTACVVIWSSMFNRAGVLSVLSNYGSTVVLKRPCISRCHKYAHVTRLLAVADISSDFNSSTQGLRQLKANLSLRLRP